MAAIFVKVFGERLVRPEALGAAATLRQVAGTQRRIIIKSSSFSGAELGAREWAAVTAFWKPATHPLVQHAVVCKSVEAPAGTSTIAAFKQQGAVTARYIPVTHWLQARHRPVTSSAQSRIIQSLRSTAVSGVAPPLLHLAGVALTTSTRPPPCTR